MTRKWLCMLGILTFSGPVSSQHRWLSERDSALSTDGQPTEIALPHPGSGPTTVALAADGSVHTWPRFYGW